LTNHVLQLDPPAHGRSVWGATGQVAENDPLIAAAAPNATVAITTLGAFAINVRGASLPRPNGRAARLLKFLLCRSSLAAPKEQIAESLWPDDPKGLKNLHAAAHDVRVSLSVPSILHYRASEYCLDSCQVDANQFEGFTNTGHSLWMHRRSDACAAYWMALAVYQGPFLPEELYSDWVSNRRERLENAFIESALRLGEYALDRGDMETAHGLAGRVIELDGTLEAAVRLEMRALRGLGRRAQALRRFERLKAQLDREFHCRPDPATQAVRAQLIAD
jgi:DNA-binding SARP family transcriptional activator